MSFSLVVLVRGWEEGALLLREGFSLGEGRKGRLCRYYQIVSFIVTFVIIVCDIASISVIINIISIILIDFFLSLSLSLIKVL